MRLDRRSFVSLAATSLAMSAGAQTPPPGAGGPLLTRLPQPTETMDLWPAAAPGASSVILTETVIERSTDAQLSDRAVFGISRPRMVVFRPARPNGAAILIMPGGGYKWVVVDKEGYELGRWLSERGYTVFVLFYRLPGEGWAYGPDVVLQDAQRAMRLIRHRAVEFGVDPDRIGALGFSAGGHACADLSARFAVRVHAPIDDADMLSARPMIAGLLYPVISMATSNTHPGSREKLLGASASAELERIHSPHLNVPTNAPPHFILHAEDDPVVPVENSLLLRAALKKKDVAVETHLFTHGGHGFGLRKALGKPVECWPALFLAWSKTQGL